VLVKLVLGMIWLFWLLMYGSVVMVMFLILFVGSGWLVVGVFSVICLENLKCM